MTYKEIYDELTGETNLFFVVKGKGFVVVGEDGKYKWESETEPITMNLHSKLSLLGRRPTPLAINAFKDFEFEGIDQEGLWEIKALLVYEPKSEKDDEYLFIGYSEVKFIK